MKKIQNTITPNKGQTKDTQVSVRLDDTLIDRLDHIDRYAGLGRAELLRRALIQFIKSVEQTGEVTVVSRVPPYRPGVDGPPDPGDS